MPRILSNAALAAIVALPAAFAAASLPSVARAEPVPPHITVVGEGEKAVQPDMAILSLSVMREAPTARAALDASNEAIAAVIAAMKSAGIAERDLQTAGLQINPRYDYVARQDGGQEGKLAAYQVTNTLSVRVRDIAKTGELLDQAVTQGVNQGGSVTFTNDDPSATITEARTRAVKDAIEKAKTLAAAAGVELGRLTEMTEVTYNAQPVAIAAKAFDSAGAQSVPLQAGENAYRVQVNVTFELK